ncbi:transketolase [candidate division KSB1 bacterium]
MRFGLNAEQLKEKAAVIRRDIITMLAEAKSGHSGGPLSVADFGTALFFNEADIDPEDPGWDGRDYIHFSIGHVTPVIYSLMAEAGYFPKKDLLKFRKIDGHLQGHPSKHETRGIEVSAGSLGQGLSVAVGMALGIKLDNEDRRVYCIMGDGEQQEGQIWEAAMSASHYRLDNLLGIVDLNGLQIDGATRDIMNIDPLAEKYRSFGWHVIEIDGHDMNEILSAFKEAREVKGKPTVIIASTVMGKGASLMENDHTWHGKPPTKEQAEMILEELGTTYERWIEYLNAG